MEELQSILFEDFEISLPGFSLRRVALNQHMPRIEKLSEHRHDYHQWLLYLRGRGKQLIEDRTVEVARGTVLHIERRVRHRFVKESELRPLCLVIDFDTDEKLSPCAQSVISGQALQEVERLLVAIHEEENREAKRPLAISSLLLQTVALLDDALRETRNEPLASPAVNQVMHAVSRMGLVEASPRIIAEACGCTLDHLNRRLKSESGKTVGGMLNDARIEACTAMLRETAKPIGEIGAAIGMDDQNYFSRWFRRQTRQTPTQWRMPRNNS